MRDPRFYPTSITREQIHIGARSYRKDLLARLNTQASTLAHLTWHLEAVIFRVPRSLERRRLSREVPL